MGSASQFIQRTHWVFRFMCLLLIFIPQMVTADNSQTEGLNTAEALSVMPVVLVEATGVNPTNGTTIIDKEMIKNLPKSNGNLTELLKTVPGVQFSEDFENSKTAGEIRPAEISIAGGRTEDNNYILDGTGNNSLLDPAYSDIKNADNIPGHSQELFILDHLIDNIKVLRANIPARYGGFSGGVIDIETIDPEPEFGGRVSYGMTRSTWGKFHLDPDDKETFNNSTDAENQPDFTKYRVNATLNIPLNEKVSLLFDYARLHSKIPLELIGDEKVQYRENENIFLKFVATPKSGTELKLSATYAPYEGTYYLKNTLNSDYKLIGGGWRLNGLLDQDTDKGMLGINLNIQESHNSREAPANWYSWRASPNKDWGTLLGIRSSMLGGYGDIEKSQNSYTASLNFKSNPSIIKKKLTHYINTGLELSYAQATFDRTETSVDNIATLADGSIRRINADGSITYYPIVSCPTNDLGCIESEQYISYRKVRPEDNATAHVLNLGLYIEDTIESERLTLRPGVRVSYNDFQRNSDVDPRLSTSFDLWGDDRTVLIAGVNRYHNTNLLTLNLEEQKSQYELYRRSLNPITNEPEAWEPLERTRFSASRTSNLKTPYSDEWNIGLQQRIFGGQSEIIYVNRDYKDQIVSVILERDDSGYTYKEWQNSGRRKHEELSLSWFKNWRKHYLSLNITWQKTKSNSSSYADYLENEPNEIDYVWYDGKLMLREELPPNNFNRPIKASLVYITKLAYGFSFTNTTNYRSRYKALTVDGTDPDGVYDAYSITTVPSALIFDWKISWMSPTRKGYSLECTLDVLNVFDRKTHYGPEDNDYLIGRQFWAGLEFNF